MMGTSVERERGVIPTPKRDREQLGTRQTKPFPTNDVIVELLFCGHESQKWLVVDSDSRLIRETIKNIC